MKGVAFTVFHVDGENGFRGGERQLLYLAAALRARGHRNIVCCRRGSDLEAHARRQGFEIITLPFLFEFDPVSAWLLARAAGRHANPIIHAHTAHAAAVASLARALRGFKTVVHRRVDFNLAGGLSRKIKYESAGRVVAVSKAIADILRADGMPEDRLAVIPDSLPSTEEEWRWTSVGAAPFSPPSPEQRHSARAAIEKEFGISAGKSWVGNLAALVPHKDHDTLIAAALIVVLKRPETVFLIAGRGSEENRLLASIKRMGLFGKVILLGHRDDPEVFLRCLDVFVLSSWGEGMGSVLLEAAASGVPVAATSAGGIPETIENGSSGLLAPPRDGEALAGCILKLLEDRSLAARLANQARLSLPRFGLAQMAKRMEEIYAVLP